MYAHGTYSRSSVFPSFRPLALFTVFALILSSLSLASTVQNHSNSLGIAGDIAAPAAPAAVVPAAPSTDVPPAPMAAEHADMTQMPDLSSLPLSFVPNVGQTDPTVQFQAHAMGGSVFFTPKEVVLSLPIQHSPELALVSNPNQKAVVGMQFVGANVAPTVSGGEQLPGIVNYFYGSDPSQWMTNIATYSGITYEQLYPGINLRYDGNGGVLKGTYTVAAGANPNVIRWRYSGATGVSLDAATGSLRVAMAGTSAPLIEQAPVAWQVINGQHVPVAASYTLAENGSIGFALGTYNPAYALTIDPALIYSTYLGGSGIEIAKGLAVDQEKGVVYITGSTNSSGFPGHTAEGKLPVPNDETGTEKSGQDIFVMQLDVQSNEVLYSTYMGGAQDDVANAIALGENGDVYITGSTQSPAFDVDINEAASESQIEEALNPQTTFPITPTTWKEVDVVGGKATVLTETLAYDHVFEGTTEAFVAKISPDGTQLLYSTYLGGSGDDEGYDIAVYTCDKIPFYLDKPYEFAFVTGKTTSDDFTNPEKDVMQPIEGEKIGNTDAFAVMMNPFGTWTVYNTYLGGSGDDEGYGIALNANALGLPLPFITGSTDSDQFAPAFTNTLSDTADSGTDAFLVGLTLDATTMVLTYSLGTYLGGSSADIGKDIALDDDGNIYLVGDTRSSNFEHMPEDVYQDYEGVQDAFVLKLNPDATEVDFGTFLGTGQDDFAEGIALDADTNVYVTGYTLSGVNFPTKEQVPQVALGDNLGGEDAFITVLQPDGSDLVYSTLIGAGATDESYDIAVFGTGALAYAFIVGRTTSTGFPIEGDPPLQESYNQNDAFIAKVGPPRFTATQTAYSEAQGVGEIVLDLATTSSTDFKITYATYDCEGEWAGDEKPTETLAGSGDGPQHMRSISAATAGEDYTAIPTTTKHISATLEAIDPITVTIDPDDEDEVDEQFCLRVITGFGEEQKLTMVIVDDDGPEVKFDPAQPEPVELIEGATISVTTFSAILNPVKAFPANTSPQTVTVGFGQNNTHSTASADDFTVITQSPLVFAPGASGTALQQGIEVQVVDDEVREAPETLVMDLSEPNMASYSFPNPDPEGTDTTIANVTRAFLGDDPTTYTATVTITDNDPVRYVRFVTDTFRHGVDGFEMQEIVGQHTIDAATPSSPINVELVDAEGEPALCGDEVAVRVKLTPGTASTATDYGRPFDSAGNQSDDYYVTVTIPAGNTEVGFTVPISGDRDAEDVETINFEIEGIREASGNFSTNDNPDNASVTTMAVLGNRTSATGYIDDTDKAPKLNVYLPLIVR